MKRDPRISKKDGFPGIPKETFSQFSLHLPIKQISDLGSGRKFLTRK